MLLSLAKEQPAWVLPDLPLTLTHASSQARSSESAQAKASTSKLHMKVSRVVCDMGVQHTNETETGGLSVDIELDTQDELGVKVVEVDGPLHYCVTDTRRELGSTVFKRWLLAAQDLRCVSVPYISSGVVFKQQSRRLGLFVVEASANGVSCLMSRAVGAVQGPGK